MRHNPQIVLSTIRHLTVSLGVVLALLAPSVTFAFSIDGVATSSAPYGVHTISGVDVFPAISDIESFTITVNQRFGSSYSNVCVNQDIDLYWEFKAFWVYGFNEVVLNDVYFLPDCNNGDGSQSIGVIIETPFFFDTDVSSSNALLVASLADFSDRFTLAVAFFLMILITVLTYLILKPL